MSRSDSDSLSDSRSHSDSGHRRFELLVACLLGVAALLIAFATLRASLLGDAVLQGYTESTQYYNDAIGFENAQNQQILQDQGLFLRYVDADRSGDVDLVDYLRTELFSPNLAAAVEWWEAANDEAGVQTPFDEASPYQDPFAEEIAEQNRLGDEAFEKAREADDRGDKFDIAAAILAITLFAAGVASLLDTAAARRATIGIALAALALGAWFVAQGQFG